jgi:hypothetical protein
MKLHSILLFLLIGFAANAQTDSLGVRVDSVIKEPLKVDFKGYRMTVPEGWVIKTGCLEEQCTFTSPRDTVGGFDTYIESINLVVNKLSNAGYTVDKYADFSIGYLPKVVNNFKVIEKRKLKANAYRVTYAGEKNNLLQTWRQYYYVKNGKVYIVTFSAETRKYDYYQPIIEPYLNSFVLK